MSNETTTADAVIEQLEESLSDVETEVSRLADGVRATIPENEIGVAQRLLRRNGYDFTGARGPSSENLIVNIRAELDDSE